MTRLFYAINLTDETKAGLAALADSLKVSATKGRLVPTANMHLTLAFLGECDEDGLAAATEVLAGLNFSPFELKVERIGRFKRRGGDIWWAGIAEDEALMALQSSLADRLRAAEFKLEERRFKPHITLARDMVTDSRPTEVEAFGQAVRSVELMSSDLSGKAPVYKAVATQPANTS